jgi:hypothetical protein
VIVDFNKIPEQAKIWIFPSSRKFYPQEIDGLQKKIENFLNSWEDEKNSLTCAYKLNYDRFIILAIDDTKISLSLTAHDTLTAFIQELEKQYKLILLDRMNVCYKQGKFVQYKDLKEFKTLIKNKAVSKKTVVFNNLIHIKEELDYDWEINIMDSWLGRFVK